MSLNSVLLLLFLIRIRLDAYNFAGSETESVLFHTNKSAKCLLKIGSILCC